LGNAGGCGLALAERIAARPPVESCWEAGADDRDIDKYFSWRIYCEAEDRSLDRLHEKFRREEAATRAVMNLKFRLLDAGIWVRPTSGELVLMVLDWRTWAETERDPEKAAKLRKHGDRCEALARNAQKREVEAKANPLSARDEPGALYYLQSVRCPHV
jgi:hypothetical protein